MEVENICDVDLSPFIVAVVRHQGQELRFRQPLTLVPELDDTEQLMRLQAPELGIDVFAVTRDALWEELSEQVAMLWEEYAEAPAEVLSPPAAALKEKLLAALEVVADAEG
ncbi:MAG: hypothetical protein AB1578_21275 [Thermodesulfobacteriota bacterium]